MPHDANGRLLKVGDTVIVECIIENIQMQDEYCNVNLKTKIPMPPYKEGYSLTLNTKQTMLYGRNEVDSRDYEYTNERSK